MTSYPQGLDVVRRWVDTVDDMIAADLNKLFDLAVAIETELGVEPSGRLGTVRGRLLAKGNLSQVDGLWRRMEWAFIPNLDSLWFDEQAERGDHFRVGFTVNRFRGISTALGDEVPAVFMVLQAEQAQYSGWPWNISVLAAEQDHAKFWARDGVNARLSTANRRSDVNVGVLIWGLI